MKLNNFKKKQKEFIAPLIAAALPTLVAGTATMIPGMIQSSNQAEAAQKQSDEQIKAMNRQTQAINALAKANPAAAQQFAMAKSYSTTADSVMYGVKTFAAVPPSLWSQLKDTAVNVYKALPNAGRTLKMGIGFAGTAAAGKYLTGKYISHDAEKSGIDLAAATQQNKAMAAEGDRPDLNMQRTYSILDRRYFADVEHTAADKVASVMGKVGKVGKEAFTSKANLGFAALGSVGDVMSWKQEKENLLAMKNQAPQAAQVGRGGGSVMSGYGQRQFAAMPGIFFKNVGKKIVNTAANFMGVGGQGAIKNAGQSLVKSAGDNAVQRRVGQFMADHSIMTAAGIGIPAGMALMSAGDTIGSKAVELPTRALDKKAYAWQDYQDSKVM